ncbi:MAG TPA: PEP-utilizing enzyme [Candidatus Limnocylindrales bacterium]|nr:PEP-utilizing enzyme [Candidatus Limnocylindrales bacterium]
MNIIPQPIFEKDLQKISWIKILDREYSVQYYGLAVSILDSASYHFPVTSFSQIVIPGEGNNSSFFIDKSSWDKLVEGLNKKYSADAKKLENYERQFFTDGNNYLEFAKEISKIDFKKVSNNELLSLLIKYLDLRDRYSVFAWSAFILNNFVADHATEILDKYIKKNKSGDKRQQFIDSLFKPEKLAAVLRLQNIVEQHKGNIDAKKLNQMYEQFKWLSCLDIQNNPWTKNEFKNHIKSFTKTHVENTLSFEKVIEELKLSPHDLEYLKIAKRFVYIKDARDDFRRESVFYAGSLYKEIAKRINISIVELSFLQESEIEDFLSGKKTISKTVIQQRKKGFVLYLDKNNKLVCLEGDNIQTALKAFNLLQQEDVVQEITGRTASKGMVTGNVAIVKGIKDLKKVKKGNILVAVTTHPDYVSAMRISAAIITNEGGITSHAAIVSREYGIPCIVGTKIATTVLKDGDLVEVDADKGTVKLIS